MNNTINGKFYEVSYIFMSNLLFTITSMKRDIYASKSQKNVCMKI